MQKIRPARSEKKKISTAHNAPDVLPAMTINQIQPTSSKTTPNKLNIAIVSSRFFDGNA